MKTQKNSAAASAVDLVCNFWQLFSEQRWDEARAFLADDFVAFWPQSKESMTADNFISVNRFYPGNHNIKVIRANKVGDQVITTVWIEADTGQQTFAISYFKIHDGKILALEEYWAEPYPAPESRRQWVTVNEAYRPAACSSEINFNSRGK